MSNCTLNPGLDTFSINDLKGTTSKEISLTSSQNQFVLSTETFINGTYICKLVVNSDVKASTKFIINHP
ncbi:MAG: T9SS type A sorting domain-containing protein [Bacteroidales bacterium]|nr:T9SS type A sorting domain-containing protein [Bacteroidales bacterium]